MPIDYITRSLNLDTKLTYGPQNKAAYSSWNLDIKINKWPMDWTLGMGWFPCGLPPGLILMAGCGLSLVSAVKSGQHTWFLSPVACAHTRQADYKEPTDNNQRNSFFDGSLQASAS